MNKALFGLIFIFSLFLSACGGSTVKPKMTPIPNGFGCTVTAPPEDKDGKNIYDPFYTKYCSVGAIPGGPELPILASKNVPNEALQQAWYIIMNMTASRPEVLKEMSTNGVKIVVLGVGEVTTNIPEYRFLRNDHTTNWDVRARGLGGTKNVPVSSGAEENLLCYEKDVYKGENIFVHEFAHTVLNLGVPPAFVEKVKDAYANAMKKRLWKNTYADDNYEEYWAEGAQSYFNVNLEYLPPNSSNNPIATATHDSSNTDDLTISTTVTPTPYPIGDGIHNFVNTRAELKEYDPDLYNLLAEIFSTFDWTPKCPTLPHTATPTASRTSTSTSTPVPATATIDVTPNTTITYEHGNTTELTGCTGSVFAAKITDPNGISRVFVQFFVSAGDLIPGSFQTPSAELELIKTDNDIWSGTFNDTISRVGQITYWQFVAIDNLGNRTELYINGVFSFYARDRSCP